MKNYDEIIKEVLARRDAYRYAVNQRRKTVLRVGVPVLSVCLAVIIGLGYNGYRKIYNVPELIDDTVVPGIDDTEDPDETEACVLPPIPGGAVTDDDLPVTQPYVDFYDDVPSVDESGGDGGREDKHPEISDEIRIEPHWAEKALYTKYPEFELNGIRYTTAATWIDADKLGEKIGLAISKGYDIYTDTEYTMEVTVYGINGISTSAAVAVSYNGFDGQYAVYYDVWYKPETLGNFMSDLNLYENLSFGTLYYTTFEYESYMTVEYNIDDTDVIFNLLRDNSTSVNEADNVTLEDMSFYNRAVSISVNVDILGIENVSLSICENGYVQTNILGARKLFCIGEDRAQKFIEYVKSNFESVREDKLVATTTAEPHLSEDEVFEDIVVTAVTQISPPYDPTKDEAIPEIVAE